MFSTTWYNRLPLKLCCRKSVWPRCLGASSSTSRTQQETFSQVHRLCHLRSPATYKQGRASSMVSLFFPVSFLPNWTSYCSNEIICYFDQIKLWRIWHKMRMGSRRPPTLPNLGAAQGGLFQIHGFGARTAFSGSNTVPTTSWPILPQIPEKTATRMFLQLLHITPNCYSYTFQKPFQNVS